MQGSLALHRGVVYVGRQAKTASVEAFDLEGRRVGDPFTFRDPRIGRSVVAGLAVDDERRVWVADTPASRVRIFTLFGREIGGLGLSLDSDPESEAERDQRGLVRSPVAVCARGDSDGLLLCVGAGGSRRHAVQLFDQEGRALASLRPGGDPRGTFRRVSGVAMRDEWVLVAEREACRVQLFRDGAFHFAFAVQGTSGSAVEPSALATLADGRVVVTWAGRSSGMALFDTAGNFVRRLAEEGEAEGSVSHPGGVVVEPASDDRRARVVVIDCEGTRVQVFNLEGRCYGSFV